MIFNSFFQELVRGGIRVNAVINYQLEPQIAMKVCIPQFKIQSCLNVYDEWPGNYVDIYAFYQFRKIKWCSGWLGIPYVRKKKSHVHQY